MAWCSPCGRSFVSFRALEQHEADSPAHQNDSDSDNGYDSNYYGVNTFTQPYQSRSYSVDYDQSDDNNNNNSDSSIECNACYSIFARHESLKQHSRAKHAERYCVPCDRMFQNANNLMQHQHSRVHQGRDIKCLMCQLPFTTASGLAIHLESGACSSGADRAKLNKYIQKLDYNHVITRPQLEYTKDWSLDNDRTIDAQDTWNGSGFQCDLCQRVFRAWPHLKQHLSSPTHAPMNYNCPNRRACGKQFSCLSGLVQHIESESCGLMSFDTVQQQARDGLGNLAKRMITN